MYRMKYEESNTDKKRHSFIVLIPHGMKIKENQWSSHFLSPHVGARRPAQRPACNSVSLPRRLNTQDGKINFKLNQSNLLNQLIMRFRVREQSCLRSVRLVKRLHCELYFIFIFEPRQPNSFPHNFSTHFTMERPIKDNCNKCGIRFSPSFLELI